MSSTLSDFFGNGNGNGEKVCACGATENLLSVGYNYITRKPDMYICLKCQAEIAAKRAASAQAARDAVVRAEANTEADDQ